MPSARPVRWLALVAPPPVNWPGSGPSGLLVAIIIIDRKRPPGTGWEAMVLDVSGPVFFVAVPVVTLAPPRSGLRARPGAESTASLAAAA